MGLHIIIFISVTWWISCADLDHVCRIKGRRQNSHWLLSLWTWSCCRFCCGVGGCARSSECVWLCATGEAVWLWICPHHRGEVVPPFSGGHPSLSWWVKNTVIKEKRNDASPHMWWKKEKPRCVVQKLLPHYTANATCYIPWADLLSQ